MNEDQEEELRQQIGNVQAFKGCFNSEDGARVIKYLKKICHYEVSTINPSEKRDLSEWREGRRSVLLDILRIMELDVTKFKGNFEKNLKNKNKENTEDSWLF